MTNTRILYIWDPLCGWCYGFTSIISKLREKFEPETAFEIISGGLAVNNKVGPISQKAIFIKKKLPDVERIASVKFGGPYLKLLDEGTYISDSLPPSIAFNIFKTFRPGNAFDFSHAIHLAHFEQGKDLNNIKTYLEISEKFEINKHAFMERFEDPDYKKRTEDQFEMVKNWGVEKYPSLMIKYGSDIKCIQKGYAGYDEIELHISANLKSGE